MVETRPVTVEDYEGRLPADLYTDYAKMSGQNPSEEMTSDDFYTKWTESWRQTYLEKYEMKRFVVTVSARKECASSSVMSSVMNNLMTFSGGNPPDCRVKGGFGGTVPSGKYLLVSFSVNDERGGKCVIRCTWQMAKEWQKVKLED